VVCYARIVELETTMHVICAVELHATLNSVKIPGVAHNYFYSEFISLAHNKTLVALHINYPKYLFDFNQI
jgi:hypothetical protein